MICLKKHWLPLGIVMSLSLLILPISFVAIWVLISNYLHFSDRRLNFLMTMISVNGYLVIIVEILSLVNLITKASLFIFWSIPIVLLIVLQLIPGTRRRLVLPQISLKYWSWFELVLLSLIGFTLIITGVTALFAAPNTPDVMNYHLPRVFHWIQNQSVRHFPSGIEIQNTYPPGSKYQVMQLVMLSGNDRLVNLPAWFMLVGSVVCVSYLSELFGANRRGQLLSALFIATLPNAIMQASSVKNDIHVAFWVMLSLTLMMVYFYQNSSWKVLIAIFAAVGLGFLTKTNTAIFLFPIIVWFSIVSLNVKDSSKHSNGDY